MRNKTLATINALCIAFPMFLGAGEWAFFPWSSSVDLFADAAQGTPVLEILVFQAAA